ncbi:MAG TPA: potassium transporter Kup [Alphaproteobacteria bacterium]|nr:potassium transporter Kup [Alphaproteobacteria bacterium]
MKPNPETSYQTALTVGALGVVFGDIGTSPLYTLQASFAPSIGLPVIQENILGVLSLVFWLLTIVVTGQYVSFIIRMDNKCEGGILSLHALTLRTTASAKLRRILIFLGLAGAGLFYGDSLITPAISVLSAVEGLQVATPSIHHLVVPITVLILIGLFMVQKHGTRSIGRFFGPVMLVWFAVIGLLGLRAIITDPVVLHALNPLHGIQFIFNHKGMSLLVLGAVMLAVTGCEAIYVDLGHFGRKPVQRAWLFIALPCLLLNYFGQGAMLLTHPEAADNPFFRLAPEFLQLPLVILATAATVIASQATISGAYSITRQAMQLGYMPRMHITHTSEREAGQIYIPLINTILMLAVIFLVVSFRSSNSLAAAYGISVIGTMIITTLLSFQVTHKIWGWRMPASLALCLPMLVIYGFLLSANLLKIIEGGWVTLSVAGILFVVMLTWYDGSRYVMNELSRNTMLMKDFLALIAERRPLRVPGTAIYLVRTLGDAPHSLVRSFRHNHIIHNRLIVVHVNTVEVPRVNRAERYRITDIGENVLQLEAQYGFMEFPNIPLLLRQCVEEKKLDLEMADTSFFVSRVTLIPDPHAGLPLWQAVLYAWLYVNSVRAHDFYRIPTNKALEIGIQMRV